jgi:large subunit ribosomal protein L13
VKTSFPKIAETERKWFLIDAQDQVLGRIASEVAYLLKGKHKPAYSPHMDSGDHVVVVNADKIRVTGKKAAQKRYTRYTGYPGGLRAIGYSDAFRAQPAKVFLHAVQGMLPKNHLGKQMLNKLRIYTGPEHPHIAQKPESLPDNLRKI